MRPIHLAMFGSTEILDYLWLPGHLNLDEVNAALANWSCGLDHKGIEAQILRRACGSSEVHALSLAHVHQRQTTAVQSGKFGPGVGLDICRPDAPGAQAITYVSSNQLRPLGGGR